jgi:hypothetical protein
MAAVRTKSLRAGAVAQRRQTKSRGIAGLNRLRQLEARVARTLAAVEDEIDYRVAVARWEHHVKHKTRLLTGEEAWRELGLPD